MTLTDADIKELFGIIQYSTRKNIQYGDYLYDTIIEDSKIVKGIERLLDEQTNATTMEDGYYFILKIVQILKTARNIPLTANDMITEWLIQKSSSFCSNASSSFPIEAPLEVIQEIIMF